MATENYPLCKCRLPDELTKSRDRNSSPRNDICPLMKAEQILEWDSHRNNTHLFEIGITN